MQVCGSSMMFNNIHWRTLHEAFGTIQNAVLPEVSLKKSLFCKTIVYHNPSNVIVNHFFFFGKSEDFIKQNKTKTEPLL